MIGTLLRPRWLGFLNRWRKSSFALKRSQDLVLLSISLFIGIVTYATTRWTLTRLNEIPTLVYLNPETPLGLVFMMLLFMIILSALITALGSFFLADDLELLFAAPLRSHQVFGAKLIYTTVAVSWMPFIFICPLLVGFGNAYGAAWYYYPLSILTLIPYFVIPTAFAVILSTLIMAVVDPRWTKVIVLLVLGTVVVGIYEVIQLVNAILSRNAESDNILRFVSILSSANTPFSPSAWAGTALSEMLHPTGKSVLVRLILLYSVAIAFSAMAATSVELLHHIGFTRAKNNRLKVANARADIRWWRWSNKPRPFLALASKEFTSLFRDLAQGVQVLFLSCVCVVYLLNLKLFVNLDAFPAETRFWWQNLFFIVHSSVAAFFTTAICTRVVFSSISLEGRSFWVLCTAPVATKQLIRAKFLMWLVPVSIISCIVFSMGALAISGRLDVAIAHAISSLFISYGIVGLGIGLGAIFSDFTWEHPSQLALGIGSFLYMLGSALLIFLNILPTWVLLQVSPLGSLALGDLFTRRGMVVACASICVAALNIAIAEASMRQGEASLEGAQVP